METEQALTAKKHINILQSRVDHLEKELLRVQEEKNSVEWLIKDWENLQITQENEFSQRLLDVENRYRKDEADVMKQINVTRFVVDKKKEERDALICALKQTTFLEYLDDDLTKVDWNTLKMKALNGNKQKNHNNVLAKAEPFSQSLEKAKHNMKEMIDLRNSVMSLKTQFDNKHSQFREINLVASANCLEKEKQIEKYRSENERLKLLIKQCAISDEPISEFVTQNIRAKYHSFLDSNNPNDLITGLKKFQQRQSKMIRMLRFMECRIIRDCNLLQVASEQTADHTQYYIGLKHRAETTFDIDFSLPNNDEEDEQTEDCFTPTQ